MTLLNTFLAVVVATLVILLWRLFLRSRERLEEKAEKHQFIPRAYTIGELAEYDGVKKPYAFVGVKGVIYNASMEWYGPEGPYREFAGRDSSRQLGKMKVGREEENADWTTLSPSHLQTLNEWEERLRSKYVAVGWICDPDVNFVQRAAAFDP